jgi:hypothetical protein
MIRTAHPGPGYELFGEQDDTWTVYYNEQEECFAIVMPEEDAAGIKANAQAEGVSVEVFLRRRWFLPDHPSAKGGSC